MGLLLSICSSVCLSHALDQQRRIKGDGYYKNTNRKPLAWSQTHGSASGRNGNQAVAGGASEALSRRLHCRVNWAIADFSDNCCAGCGHAAFARHVPVELPSTAAYRLAAIRAIPVLLTYCRHHENASERESNGQTTVRPLDLFRLQRTSIWCWRTQTVPWHLIGRRGFMPQTVGLSSSPVKVNRGVKRGSWLKFAHKCKRRVKMNYYVLSRHTTSVTKGV